MSSSPKDDLNAMNARFISLGKAIPGSMGAFQKLMGEASKDGVLGSKFKELLAVAIAVSKGCGDCIVFHVSNAKKHGATREELAETLGVSIEMGGGPGAVYAARALAAFDGL